MGKTRELRKCVPQNSAVEIWSNSVPIGAGLGNTVMICPSICLVDLGPSITTDGFILHLYKSQTLAVFIKFPQVKQNSCNN